MTIKFLTYHNSYYISDGNNNYLHFDGTIKHKIVNENGCFTGCYETKEEAQSTLNKYRPKLIFKDLKVNEKFMWKGDNSRLVKVEIREPIRKNGFAFTIKYGRSYDCEGLNGIIQVITEDEMNREVIRGHEQQNLKTKPYNYIANYA